MVTYLTHPSSFPDPGPQDAPDPGESGDGEAYRCLVCGWLGIGGANAYDHHKEAHHAIGLTYWPGLPPQTFACCSGQQQRNVG